MARTLNPKLVILASVLLAAACSKGTGAGGAAGGGKVTGPAASVVSSLPKDAQFVVGFQFDKIRQSKLWERFAKSNLQERAKLNEIQASCGIDVLAELESLVLAGLDVQGAGDKKIVVVRGKWDEDKVNKCLVTMAEKKDGKKVTIQKEGKITAYSAEGEETIYAYWVDKGTILATSKPNDKAFLQSVVDAKQHANENVELMNLLGKVSTTSTLWGASVVSPFASGHLEDMVAGKPLGMYGSLNLTKALDATIGLRFDNDNAAKATTEKLQKELETARANPMFGQYAKAVEAKSDAKDALVTIKMNEKELDDLVTMIEQQLAPFLMMGLGGSLGGL